MKKFCFVIVFLFMFVVFAPAVQAAGNFRVLASTYPVWLFCRNVCNGIENVKVELLIPAMAGCPHNYSPGPADLRKLENANVLVVNGLGLEGFLLNSKNSVAPNLPVIDAGRNVTPLLQSLEDPHPGEANPHIFAAPRQASIMVSNIGEGLAVYDPERGEQYMANAKAYAEQLWRLGQGMASLGVNAQNRSIALQHDALAYIAQNAGLDIVAMLPAMQNPSAARLASLQKELREAKPALIATDSQYSAKMADMISTELGIPCAPLDPVANGPENSPLDYYEKAMEKNFETLRKYYK